MVADAVKGGDGEVQTGLVRGMICGDGKWVMRLMVGLGGGNIYERGFGW